MKASRSSGSIPSSAPSTTPTTSDRRSPVGPERERVRDRRAQPVADASDPAPPADDVPGAARVENDVDPPSCEPASLVEAGLGPSRGDRARPELEHGTLRRRPPRRQLEQDPLTQFDAVEPPHLGGDPHRERRSARRARDDHLRAGRLPDAGGEDAPIELVQPEPTPPEPGGAKRDRRERRAAPCAGRRKRRGRRRNRCDGACRPVEQRASSQRRARGRERRAGPPASRARAPGERRSRRHQVAKLLDPRRADARESRRGRRPSAAARASVASRGSSAR